MVLARDIAQVCPVLTHTRLTFTDSKRESVHFLALLLGSMHGSLAGARTSAKLLYCLIDYCTLCAITTSVCIGRLTVASACQVHERSLSLAG